MESFWCPISVRLSRSWNPSPDSEIQCPFIKVLKPRFREWNPVSVYRGLETQVLRVKPSVRLSRSWTQVLKAKYRRSETQVLKMKPSVRLSRSWNPGLENETQCPFIEVLKLRSWEPNIEVLKLRSWEPNIEVLKLRSWKPNATTRAYRHGRIVSNHHGYPQVQT
jgi:hypothetical protein